jgi:hypothetical protein
MPFGITLNITWEKTCVRRCIQNPVPQAVFAQSDIMMVFCDYFNAKYNMAKWIQAEN